MKKSGKIIAFFSSFTLLATSLSVLNVNALFWNFDENSEEYKQFLDGFEPINDEDGFFSLWANDYGKFDANQKYKVYVKPFSRPTGESFLYKVEVKMPSSVSIRINDNSNVDEVVSIFEEYGYTDVIVTPTPYFTNIYFEDVTVVKAREIFEKLKDKNFISQFCYNTESSSFKTPQYDYITAYKAEDNILQILENYVVEKNLDCQVLKLSEDDDFWGDWGGYNLSCCVIPNGEVTAEEHLEIAKQIKKDLNLYPISISTTSGTLGGDSINMFNINSGDANADSEISISDVLAITAYIANPSDNHLSQLGLINADVNGDGAVTANDALTIQQYLADIITEL